MVSLLKFLEFDNAFTNFFIAFISTGHYVREFEINVDDIEDNVNGFVCYIAELTMKSLMPWSSTRV